ncbi:hypothetical protein SAMN03080594_101381 [Arenibacter palladensis]|uniref:Uncharacterized protein n=1 Tax=Arenibacter palladensis TaxID=237373 RepID=A0A1M4TUG6_9FLAO|nr:hypothetical protein SAMN03080594_101381 [Arenibacter palladensis]
MLSLRDAIAHFYFWKPLNMGHAKGFWTIVSNKNPGHVAQNDLPGLKGLLYLSFQP